MLNTATIFCSIPSYSRFRVTTCIQTTASPANLAGPPLRHAVMKSTHATPTAQRRIPREIGVARLLQAVRMHDLLDYTTPCIGAADRTDATPRDEWRSSRGIIALALLNTCAHQQNADRSRIVAQTPIVATSRLKSECPVDARLWHRQIDVWHSRLFSPRANVSIIMIRGDSFRINYTALSSCVTV